MNPQIPYEKMYLIDEAEYMRLKNIRYPPVSAAAAPGDDGDDDDDGVGNACHRKILPHQCPRDIGDMRSRQHRHRIG